MTTFGFRLTADLTRGEHLSIDEQGMEIDLPIPIGPVTLQASPGSMPTSKAQVFIFSGQGYASSDEALRTGHALKNAIRLAAIEVGKAINVGQDIAHGQPSQVIIEEFAKRTSTSAGGPRPTCVRGGRHTNRANGPRRRHCGNAPWRFY